MIHWLECGECGGPRDIERGDGRYIHAPGCPVPASERGLPPPAPTREILAFRQQQATERACRVIAFPTRE